MRFYLSLVILSQVLYADTDLALTLGRRFTAAFLKGDSETIWKDSSPALRRALGSLEQFKKSHAKELTRYGKEKTVLHEIGVDLDGLNKLPHARPRPTLRLRFPHLQERKNFPYHWKNQQGLLVLWRTPLCSCRWLGH